MTREHTELMDHIAEIAPQVVDTNGYTPIVQRLHASKQFIFKVIAGDHTWKVRVYPFMPNNIELHQALTDRGFDVPRIIGTHAAYGKVFKFVEWIDALTLAESVARPRFEDLSPQRVTEWGRCVGRLHNEKVGSEHISHYDMVWQNFLVLPDRVMCCDMSKLYRTLTPELDVFKWITLNLKLPRELKHAFHRGYADERHALSPYLEDIEDFVSAVTALSGSVA